jgi:hypothetical protein
MVHDISEGQAVVDAQKKNKVVYQVGSQGMSSLGNEKAKELFKDGAIGKLNYAEGFWARMSPFGAWQYPIPADASPKTVDWNAFVANTKKRELMLPVFSAGEIIVIMVPGFRAIYSFTCFRACIL